MTGVLPGRVPQVCTILPDLIQIVQLDHATIAAMDELPKSITWEAFEHDHEPKTVDWYWILGIVTLALMVAALLLGNLLFGVFILVCGMVLGLTAARQARTVEYGVTTRGVRIDTSIYPYSTLESFYIDEDRPDDPLLIIKSRKLFAPLLVLPLPEEYVDEIEELVASRIPEEFLEEPVAYRLLDLLGL